MITLIIFFTGFLAIIAFCLCAAAKRSDCKIETLLNGQKNNSEFAIQERGGLIRWSILNALGIWASCSKWLHFKRVCAWHQPKPIRIGGNPFAKKVTHGICAECCKDFSKK